MHKFDVNNCPVPLEKISANLNLDMISRNDPDSLFLIAFAFFLYSRRLQPIESAG
jgi:hypothetical protein